MTDTDLVDRLTKHRGLATAPRVELEWLAAHGTMRRLEVGGVLSHKGVPVENMFVILSGRISITVDRGSGPHKLAEWTGGDIRACFPTPASAFRRASRSSRKPRTSSSCPAST